MPACATSECGGAKETHGRGRICPGWRNGKKGISETRGGEDADSVGKAGPVGDPVVDVCDGGFERDVAVEDAPGARRGTKVSKGKVRGEAALENEGHGEVGEGVLGRGSGADMLRGGNSHGPVALVQGQGLKRVG